MRSSGEMRRCNHLSAEIDAVYHLMSKSMGMSDSEMMLLYTVYGNGGSCPLKEVTLCSGVSKQTLNSALRKLEAEGTVLLESADAKHKTVVLTEKGAELCGRTVSRIISAENEILSSWESEDVERYLALTERFLCDLKMKATEVCKNGK